MQSYNNYLQKILKQLKVNHKNSYYKSKNNLQAKIEDKEWKIRIKCMNYGVSIYSENIYDTLIYHKNINIKLSGHLQFCIPHLCTHLSYACVQRWHNGSMHKRGTTVLCLNIPSNRIYI